MWIYRSEDKPILIVGGDPPGGGGVGSAPGLGGSPPGNPGRGGRGKGKGQGGGDGGGSYSLAFDGADDVVDVGTLGTFGSTKLADAFTVEFWFRTSETSVAMAPLGVFNGTGSQNVTTFLVIFNQNTAGSYEAGAMRMYLRNDNGASWSVGPNGDQGVFDGEWHHFAMSVDVPNRHVYMYLDGSEILSSFPGVNLGSDFSDFQRSLFLGALHGRLDNIGNPFNGELDDVRIWGDIRTQAEIQDNMSAELAGDEDNLFAYWKFNEGSGQVAADSGPNGHDGQLGTTSGADTNDPSWSADVPF